MKLSAEGKLRLAARLVFVVGVGVISADAYAADVATDAADDQAATGGAYTGPATGAEVSTPGSAVQLGGVQVTGSRIKQPNLTGNSPVTTIGSQEIQFQGTTRAEDLLNSLPQVFADQGGNISNGSSGTATVNLRNLGSQRTLVLINGKRLQPGDPVQPASDLNFIPSALIDKVEVLTGGASAVYGSDALAGVVNFVLKKDFEGVRIDYQRSGYNHTNSNSQGYLAKGQGYATPQKDVFDGGGDQVTALMGINSSDGKGNATVYATFQHLDPVTQGQRDFSACTLAEASDTTFACSGSSTSFPGRFRGVNQIGTDASSGRPIYQAGGPNYTLDSNGPGNTLRPYNAATDAFNFGPYNYYQRNDERYGLGAFAHYKFDDSVEAYTDLMFLDDHTNAVIAPSGIFFGIPASGTPFSTSCSNPELSSDEVAKLCTSKGLGPNDRVNLAIGRRNQEGGGRNDDLRHTAYRIVTGLRGDLGPNWNYDTSLQYSTSIFTERYANDFSSAKTQRALNVVNNPANGTPTCQSVLDGTDPNCVPYNIFALGGVTPQALNYLQTPGLQRGTTSEQIVSGNISGELGSYGLKSPLAKDGIGVSFGSEYRREILSLEVDDEFATGDLAGQGGSRPSSSGGFNVRELFGEIRVPLAQHLPFVEDLSVGTAYRYSDYSTAGSTDAYKFDADWAPVQDFRFRGSFNRAVRVPNNLDSSDGRRVVLDGSTDPCAGAIGADGVVSGGATAAQCANDPVIKANPALYGTISENPAAQYNGLVGGTQGLKPETADTYTGGIVITPTFVKNLSFSVDYYDIRIKNTIGSLGADNILANCYTANNLCNLIHRDGGGSLWLSPGGYTTDVSSQIGPLSVHGIDFSGNYRFKLSQIGLSNRAGSLAFDFVGTRDITEKHQVLENDPTTAYTCNGLFGFQCGTPVPNWRHKLRGTYSVPTYWLDSVVTASAAWRYIGAVKADSLSGPNDLDSRLASVSYMDATASISFKGAYTFRVGVNNVFDKDPPIVGSGALPAVLGNGNTFPQVYDALGRYAFAGITADF